MSPISARDFLPNAPRLETHSYVEIWDGSRGRGGVATATVFPLKVSGLALVD